MYNRPKSIISLLIMVLLCSCSSPTSEKEEPHYLSEEELTPFCGTYLLFPGNGANYGEEKLYLVFTKESSYSLHYGSEVFEGTYKLWEEEEYPLSMVCVGWYSKEETRPIYGLYVSISPLATDIPDPARSVFCLGNRKALYLFQYKNGRSSHGYEILIEQVRCSVLTSDGRSYDPSLYMGKISSSTDVEEAIQEASSEDAL